MAIHIPDLSEYEVDSNEFGNALVDADGFLSNHEVRRPDERKKMLKCLEILVAGSHALIAKLEAESPAENSAPEGEGTDPSKPGPGQGPAFSLEDLEILQSRSKLEAARLAIVDEDTALERAYGDLAHQLNVIHAMEIRRGELALPVTPPSDHVDAVSEAEGDEDPYDEENALESFEPPPLFKVRPKSATRFCEVCGQKQWRSESGWVCKAGHGGVEALDVPTCCDDQTMQAVEVDKQITGFHCETCQKTVPVADLTR